jgi:hypothetical protein
MKLKALVMPEERLYSVKKRKDGFEINEKDLQFDADENDFKEWERGVRVIKLHQKSKEKWCVWNYETDDGKIKNLHWKPLRPTQMAFPN